jgi:4-nitrophenyl phosphatase
MKINYKILAKAYNYLSSNPGCQLILTNDDASFLLPHGGFCPGEGAIASVLYGALPKGTRPTIVGKPHQPLLDVVHRALHFDPKTTLFVGDRLETDVLFAKRGGIDSVLVWTGISKPEVRLPSFLPSLSFLSLDDLSSFLLCPLLPPTHDHRHPPFASY